MIFSALIDRLAQFNLSCLTNIGSEIAQISPVKSICRPNWPPSETDARTRSLLLFTWTMRRQVSDATAISGLTSRSGKVQLTKVAMKEAPRGQQQQANNRGCQVGGLIDRSLWSAR